MTTRTERDEARDARAHAETDPHDPSDTVAPDPAHWADEHTAAVSADVWADNFDRLEAAFPGYRAEVLARHNLTPTSPVPVHKCTDFDRPVRAGRTRYTAWVCPFDGRSLID